MKRFTVVFLTLVMMALLPVEMQAGSEKILKIDFKSAITEKGGSGFSLSNFSLSGMLSGSTTLYTMVRAIDYAATDPSVSMIYMTPCNVSADYAQLEEIRAALKRFRESGKTIVAYCENLSNATYYLASVADKVVLNPASESYMTGLATQQIYLKDALDALGVDVQLIRHGKYKSAGEMYIRNAPSPENIEQNQAMVNSLWNDICAEIAASRGFSSDDFKKWIDDLALVDAASFKELGLVDELWHKDEVEDFVCEQTGSTLIKFVSFVNFKRYSEKLQKKVFGRQNKKSKEKIAVIYADGEIVVSSDGTGMSQEMIVGKNLASTIAKVRRDDKVKAVVFRVNSPGGSVMASELIKREIDLLKAEKPVIASYGGYAASGGYWISACTDRIFTDRMTLTGSIGCFSMIPNLGNAIRKIAKVNIVTIGTSPHSDMMTGMRSLDAAETDFMQKQVEDIYDRFTTIVSTGRGISKDSVDAIGQGRVWTGSDALGIGLVDSIGGLADAIACAAQTAGLETYGIAEYPETVPFSLMSLFAETDDLDETVTSDTDPAVSMLRRVVPVAQFMRRKSEPVNMARMPELYLFN